MVKKGLILGFVLLAFAQFTKAQSSGIVEIERDTLIALLQEFRA